MICSNAAKPTMTARDGLKSVGAIGAACVLAGAALHGLYVLAKRKEHVAAAEQTTEEVADE